MLHQINITLLCKDSGRVLTTKYNLKAHLDFDVRNYSEISVIPLNQLAFGIQSPLVKIAQIGMLN